MKKSVVAKKMSHHNPDLLEQIVATHKAQRIKQAQWPRHNAKAHAAAEKADPGWMNADRPSLTKGHEVFKKHNR